MAFEYIDNVLEGAKEQHLLRQRVVVDDICARTLAVDGRRYLNFASNDYLALGDRPLPPLKGRSGGHSSPLVTGYSREQAELEQRFCALYGFESALLFASGFSANASVLKALFAQAREGLIVQDKLNHASLVDGGLAANAQMQRFNHNNMAHLDARLGKSKAHHKLVVSEGVFSMDGDCAPLEQLRSQCEKHRAWLMLDDAHGFGVLGEGKGSAAVLKPDILVLTFGKALAANGAIVLASNKVIDLLLQSNRDYTYSTALSALQCEVIDTRLTQLLAADAERQHLSALIDYFKSQCAAAHLALMPSDTPIQPLIVGDSESALVMQNQLRDKGIWLSAIRPPTVAHNTARLRITLTAAHTEEDIDTLVSALEQCR
ncbi:aminotransferase class I/II-fold pyridoxal phosphate-dependent enzyme [Pseudoalteromonas ruthenica]|uniref:8-amino-7-oxononanoate synthase n=1 Tax=Pseudoalteromonas ruthenica TaxID=151081 RepID=A0A0F4PXB9_9GAMM|nr:8-amino-7-oxononanoate synthase [Pseudoalteromonas ruthenica]KJY99759.1 8-amino-7-oxononanoate synthase [Pseudoalteromonas ruthenica]KJZ00023.1 8-amino-7-oxononanoate synthase [Pseudoalteromonas ruthenica]TMO88278.1 8-amino-7-oxononanoate synthase [Pseudoalteromonas ruthenica]TMO93040.1 8-amino-7-oxononanoate synthase [Pseudoalteromonas ruthenica]TMP00470.1 8-amino-7-oxononanoate synthase [Pseudoalteromonas ruthenica]